MKLFYRLSDDETTALDQLTLERSYSTLEFLAAVVFWMLTENLIPADLKTKGFNSVYRKNGRGFTPTNAQRLNGVSLPKLRGTSCRLSMNWLGLRSSQSAHTMRKNRVFLASMGCFIAPPQRSRMGPGQPIAPLNDLNPDKIFAVFHYLLKRVAGKQEWAELWAKEFKLVSEAFKHFFGFEVSEEIPDEEVVAKAAQSFARGLCGAIVSVTEYVESLQQELRENPPSPPPKGLISSALRSHLLEQGN